MLGRTARIGNIGLATSFYNEKDEDLAPSLVKVLMETTQPVPDFLESFQPEDGKVAFDDDTDNEGEENAGGDDAAGAGDAWGGAKAEPAAETGTWGTDSPAGSAGVAEKKVDTFAAGNSGGDEWQPDSPAGLKKKQKW